MSVCDNIYWGNITNCQGRHDVEIRVNGKTLLTVKVGMTWHAVYVITVTGKDSKLSG